MHYVKVPILDMRKEPFSRAEMVSQALFSEQVRKLSEIDEWCQIETIVDGYKGWVNVRQTLIPKGDSPLDRSVGQILHVNRLRAHVYAETDTIYGPILTLPFESRLVAVGEIKAGDRWIEVYLPDGTRAYVQSGDVSHERKPLSFDEVCRFSLSFLGIPYTWGGRTSFGYDCSGLVQMLYRQMGLAIGRDSCDQVQWDRLKDVPVDRLLPGDMIFYGDAAYKMKHVGMSLGDGKFIHTSAVTENMPYVRISSIKDPAWNGSGYYRTICGKTIREL